MDANSFSPPILIYLVDDDDDHLRLIEQALGEQDRGFSFRTFIAPGEALQAMAERPPDVVVSDYVFAPGDPDGLEFCRRAGEQGCPAPFIFLTGQGNEEVAAEAFRQGAADYFTKEVGFAHFIRIAQSIRRSAVHRRTESEKNDLAGKCSTMENICHQLMDEAADLIMLVDAEGRVASVNRKTMSESGYAAEELLGRPLTDLIVEEDRQRVGSYIADLAAGGPSVRVKASFRSKSGERHVMEATAAAASTEPGRLQILVIARDITEWSQREARLVWTQHLLDQVLNSMEEVIHVVDGDLRILYCNRSVETLSRGKVTCPGMMGRLMSDLFPFLEARGVLEEYRSVFAGGEPLITQETTSYETQDIVTRTEKLPIHGEDGRVDKVITIMRDITRDHQVEKEKEKLARVVEEAVVAIAIIDREGRIDYVNPRHAAIFGYDSGAQILGRSWRDLVPADQVRQYYEATAQALRETGHWVGESVALRRDGTSMPILLSLNLMEDREGERRGYVAFSQDLSREKMIDQELARKNKELEDLNQELSSFISMTSHELRSPLTNIEGFSRLLEEKLDTLSPADRKDFIARISSNAIRLHLLIDDLLLFSRERKRVLESSEVDLNSLSNEVLGQLSRLAETSGAAVSLDLGVKMAWADRQKLFQVLKNLVENALTYRRGTEPPSVRIEAREGDDGQVLFRVADNGPGILETERELVFEIFRRGAASRGKQGTGVGLALVRENVQRMGGRVWVESGPQGSTFFFTLPARPR